MKTTRRGSVSSLRPCAAWGRRTSLWFSILALAFCGQQASAQEPAVQPESQLPRIHELSVSALGDRLALLARNEPVPAARLVRIASETLGQRYAESPLGEGQYDSHDPKPLFAIDRSDSRSFVEQAIAMSVTSDYPSCFRVLQRLRYKDGNVSTDQRNHNLLADWPRANSWLFDDPTSQLGGEMAWVPTHQIVCRHDYLLKNFGLTASVPDEKFVGAFIPRCYLPQVQTELKPGDIVLTITGNDRQQYCTEMGILLKAEDDPDNPFRIIRSRPPEVSLDKFRSVIWRKDTLGFVFLRMKLDAVNIARGQAEQLNSTITVPGGEQ